MNYKHCMWNTLFQEKISGHEIEEKYKLIKQIVKAQIANRATGYFIK